jgi:hypothetical protein
MLGSRPPSFLPNYGGQASGGLTGACGLASVAFEYAYDTSRSTTNPAVYVYAYAYMYAYGTVSEGSDPDSDSDPDTESAGLRCPAPPA